MDRLFGRQAFHVAYAIAVSHLLNLWNCEATKVSLRLSFQLWQLWSNKCREVNCSWHINSILTSGKDFTTVFLVLLCAKLWKQLRERKRRNDVLQSYTQPVTPDLSKTSSCDLNQCRLCNSLQWTSWSRKSLVHSQLTIFQPIEKLSDYNKIGHWRHQATNARTPITS